MCPSSSRWRWDTETLVSVDVGVEDSMLVAMAEVDVEDKESCDAPRGG